MHANHSGIRIGVTLLLIFGVGCTRTKLKPGVAFTVSVITKGDDGRVATQGPVTRVESAVVNELREITYEDYTLLLLVRKTEYEKATFVITFSDKTSEMVRVKAGTSADVLPAGQKAGVRIEVRECR